MEKTEPRVWLASLAKTHGAVHILGVPRTEWYGGKANDETLSLSSSGGHWLGRKEEAAEKAKVPWLVVVGDTKAPDAVLCLDKPQQSLDRAQPNPGRGANLVQDFRVVWKREKEMEETISLLPREETHPAADYTQLLADAELLLYVANLHRQLPPSTFLAAALEAWKSNSAWNSPRDDALVLGAGNLRAEFVLVHMRQAQSLMRPRRGKVHVRSKLREWWAAVASIPWKPAQKSLADPDPTPDDDGYCLLPEDQRNLYLLPYRRIRTLQISQPGDWVPLADMPANAVDPFDTLILRATPNLAQAIRERMDQVQMTTVGASAGRSGTPLQRARIFADCATIRRQVRELAELADYLPPCMATVRAHGQATQHLAYSDRYYVAAFLASLGQAEAVSVPTGIPALFGAADAINEACRFFVGRSIQDGGVRELADTMRDIFHPKKGADRPIWSCAGLRIRRQENKITTGSVVYCPYTDNGQCLKAAGLASTEPLVYPAQFVQVKRKVGVVT